MQLYKSLKFIKYDIFLLYANQELLAEDFANYGSILVSDHFTVA